MVFFDYNEVLTGKQIRLIKFVERIKGHPTHSDCLHVKIITANLPNDEAPTDEASEPYLALSYVWGYDGVDNPEILIDGKSVKVTPNLKAALVYLEKSVDLPIWTDAICINQNDRTEKEQQVGQMRDVYASAARTLIWLGEGVSTTQTTMRHLSRIGFAAMQAGLAEMSAEDLRVWPDFSSYKDDIKLYDSKVKIKDDLEALYYMLSAEPGTLDPFPMSDVIAMSKLEWFGRVWVIQELAVSREYDFMCGHSIVPGDKFAAGITLSAFWVIHTARLAAQNESMRMQLDVNKRLNTEKLLEFMQQMDIDRDMYLEKHLDAESFADAEKRSNAEVQFYVERDLERQRQLAVQKPTYVNARATMTLWTRRKWQRDRPTLKQQLCRAFVSLSTAEGLNATNPRDRIFAFLGIASTSTQKDLFVCGFKRF